jgi:drug/metabolite transporter (DMT)-like permease
LLKTVPIVETQTLRYAFGTLVLCPLALATRPRAHLSRRALPRLAVAATTGAVVFNVAILLAPRTTDPSVIGVIVGCAPLAIVLAFATLQRRAPDGRLVVCSLLVLGGNVISEGGGDLSTQGILLALVALLAEVIFALSAPSLAADLGVVWLTTLTSAIALLVFGAALAASLDTARLHFSAVAALLYVGVAVTAGSFLAWYFALARLGPQRAALFVGLAPIVAVAGAELLGTGAPSGWQFAGAGVVATGLALAVAAPPRGGIPSLAEARQRGSRRMQQDSW